MPGPVVVGVDGCAPAQAAAAYAATFAVRHGLDLDLLHAFSWPLIYPPLLAEEAPPDPWPRTRARRLLDAAAAAVRETHPHLSIRTHLVDGHAAPVLIEASRRASFLVVGHRGLGAFAEMLTGSVGVHTSTHAHCPVIVVRGTQPSGDDAPVVVGVDGSPGARAAARLAFTEVRLRDVGLVVALAWPPARTWPEAVAAAGLPAGTTEVDPLSISLAGIIEDYPDVKVRSEVRHSDAPPQLLAALAAEVGAGLIVVGSRGIGGFRGLLMGGTCRALVDHAPCPIMVVPKDVTP